MLLEDLARKAADEVGEDFASIDTKEQYLEWARDVVQEILTSGRWLQSNQNFTQQYTAPETNPVALEQDASEVITIQWTDNLSATGRITYVERETLVRRGKNLFDTGTPEYWYYSGVDSNGVIQVGFYPQIALVGGQTQLDLHFYGLKQPPSLTATDTIPLPEEFLSVAREGILFRSYRNTNDVQLATLALQNFNSRLQLLNARFQGPFTGGSNLPVQTGIKRVDQAPGSQDGS